MSITDDPRYWWDRAEEARSLSELMSNPDAKRKMLEIADGYARVAERIETARGRSSFPN
jgi:hypothetical protein